jgi:hypothetical protein
MKRKSIFTLTVMAAALAGCGGGAPDQIACGSNGNQIVCRTDGKLPQSSGTANAGTNGTASPSTTSATSPATQTQTGSTTSPVAPSIPAPSTQTPTPAQTPPSGPDNASAGTPPAVAGNVITVGSKSVTWPANPFFVTGFTAPPDKAVLHGIQILSVVGSGLVNVELLPATGFEPKYAPCAPAKDFDFTIAAECIWDTSKLPNGWVTVRLAAFNVPAGEQGDEIDAVTRTYFLANGICTSGQVLSPGQSAFCAGQIGPDGQPINR